MLRARNTAHGEDLQHEFTLHGAVLKALDARRQAAGAGFAQVAVQR